MGRIKEISRKSAHTRKRNPVLYLICEGSETEIRYFKRFRSRGCNIDIIPISSQYKSADRLVQKAKATMGNNPYYPEDGDSIWCVFDRDDNSNEVLLRAKQSAQKEGYHLAYSNPSFELWFLLHFVNQQTEVEDCQALIRLLKQPKRIPDYEKNKDCFDVLKPLQAATTIYLWLISLTASKELSILLLKLYNDGAIGISNTFLDSASVIKTDNQLLIRSVRFMQVESP